jgi:hypothetical protein
VLGRCVDPVNHLVTLSLHRPLHSGRSCGRHTGGVISLPPCLPRPSRTL